MNDSELYIEYLENNLDYASEIEFATRLVNDDAFRSGFKNYLGIITTINNNVRSFGPTIDETGELFYKLGYSMQPVSNIDSDQPNKLKKSLLQFSKYFFTGLIAAIVTAFVLLHVIEQKPLNKEIATNSDEQRKSLSVEKIAGFHDETNLQPLMGDISKPSNTKALNDSNKIYPEANNNSFAVWSRKTSIDNKVANRFNNGKAESYAIKPKSNITKRNIAESNEILCTEKDSIARTNIEKKFTNVNKLIVLKKSDIKDYLHLNMNNNHDKNNNSEENNRFKTLYCGILNKPNELSELEFSKQNQQLGFSVELKNSLNWNLPKETMTASNQSIFNNIEFSVLYSITSSFDLGIDIRQETYFVNFISHDTDGLLYQYEGQPNLTSFGLTARLKLFDFNNLSGYLKAMPSVNNMGLIIRSGTGLSYRISDNVALTLGLEFSEFWYKQYNTTYNTSKLGINYGTIFTF